MKDNKYFGLTCEALCEGLATLIHRYEESGIDFYISWSYGEWGKGQHTIKKHINEILSDAIKMLKNQHEEIERLKKQDPVAPLTIDDAVRELMDKHYKRLKKYEAKLLTFDEVKKHFLVPKELFGSIEEYIDYANDIEPLYMECRIEDAFVCHWRTHENISMRLDDWKNEYGKTWRCWTKKPTQEQKNEVKWE